MGKQITMQEILGKEKTREEVLWEVNRNPAV